jgi:biotin carboxylase
MAGLQDRGRDARIIPKAFLGNFHRLSVHPIWCYDEREFHAEYGISSDKYRSIAWKQSQHLEEMLIAALIEEGYEIHAGYGHMMSKVESSTTFTKAKSCLMGSLPKKMQQSIRHQRRYGEALKNGRAARTSNELWF